MISFGLGFNALSGRGGRLSALRMTSGMDFLQLLDGHSGVDLLVPEQLLDATDIGPALEHVGGSGMPQQIATALLGNTRLLHPFGDTARDNVRIERVPVAGGEQGLRAHVQAKPWAGFAQITFDPRYGSFPHRHHAVLLALALPDGERAPGRIQVRQLQPTQLSPAHPGRVKHFKIGVTPKRESIRRAPVEPVRLRRIATALLLRATREPGNGFDSFGGSHERALSDAMFTLRQWPAR